VYVHESNFYFCSNASLQGVQGVVVDGALIESMVYHPLGCQVMCCACSAYDDAYQHFGASLLLLRTSRMNGAIDRTRKYYYESQCLRPTGGAAVWGDQL
jgi:hypothetical protein